MKNLKINTRDNVLRYPNSGRGPCTSGLFLLECVWENGVPGSLEDKRQGDRSLSKKVTPKIRGETTVTVVV